MNKVAKILNQNLIGNVYDEPKILEAYSTDRSVMKIVPRMVVVPENTDDVRRTVRFVDQLAKKGIKLPITVRGSGLDKTGADLTNQLCLSMERMNHIQEIDTRARLVRVQAGVTLHQLNSALALHGLNLPVDANPDQTIGSLISNFITDHSAGKYNGIAYYLDCIEVVLSDGSVLHTSAYAPRAVKAKKAQKNFEGKIYRKIDELIQNNADLIADLRRQNRVDAAGYRPFTEISRKKGKDFDLLPLFCAAQGTLGVITEVILRAEVTPAPATHFAAAFESSEDAIVFLQRARALTPLTLRLYDARIFHKAVSAGKDIGLFAKRFDNGYIALIAFNDAKHLNRKKMRECLKLLPENSAAVIETLENHKDFQRIQTALMSYLNDNLRGERASLTDDFFLPPQKMIGFLKELKVLAETYRLELPLFGDYATAIYSLRPDFELGTPQDKQVLVKFLKDFAFLLDTYGGALSGGAPEGRIKAIITNRNLPSNEQEVYQKIKDILDPRGIFNPNVKLGSDSRSVVRHLREEYNAGITTE